MTKIARRWLRKLLKDCVGQTIPAKVKLELCELGVHVDTEHVRIGNKCEHWSFFLKKDDRKRAEKLLEV